MLRGILTVQDYGRVVLHLKEYMDTRGINRNQLASAIGTSFYVINKWYDGNVDRIDADLLARICHVLDCQVQDIITYEPAKEK